MNFIPPLPWWPLAARARRDARDGGDMGTAFGLDASLEEIPPCAPDVEGKAAWTRVSPRTGLPRVDPRPD